MIDALGTDAVSMIDLRIVDLSLKQRIDASVSRFGSDPRDINQGVARLLEALTENLVITSIVDRDYFFKVGLSRLLSYPEFQVLERVMELASFFDGFDHLYGRLIADMRGQMGETVRVFIGRENGFRGLGDESVIVAQYALPGGLTGTVTVIGPMRMNYQRNLGLVGYTAETVNAMNRD